jgi:hypothetical protein
VALLYDAYGREVYPDGVTHDTVRDAIQAASRADDWRLAAEIAMRYRWRDICLYCAEAPATELYQRIGGWPVCEPCKTILEPPFTDMRIYMDGLFKRDVQ